MFPPEIWEEILKHADPVDLLRFKRVSKCWYAIIPKILEQSDGWYKKCQTDVPYGMWGSILEQQNHAAVQWQNFHLAKNHPSVWKALYRSWMDWRKLSQKTYCIEETRKSIAEHRPLERITCVAVLNNIIAVGSSEGYITFHDITENLVFKIDHGSFIQDIQLWRNGADHIIVTSSTMHGRVNHWDMHDRILCSQSRGTLISANFQYCYMLMNNILTVHRPGIYCDEENEPVVEARYELPDFGKVSAICANRQKVTLWTEGNNHYDVFVNGKGSGYNEFQVDEPNIPIRFYKIFRPCIAGCIGELGEFGFSISGKKWKIYNPFSKFYAPVTAMLFHVALLVLGFGSGEVHLFAVEDVNSLLSLDFEKMESKKLALDTSPIISLNAMENDSINYIVAATDKNLYVVKF